jgi:hypothetical protein
MLGDDSDAPESRDFTAEVIREILCQLRVWDCTSCAVVEADVDPVLRVPGWGPDITGADAS